MDTIIFKCRTCTFLNQSAQYCIMCGENNESENEIEAQYCNATNIKRTVDKNLFKQNDIKCDKQADDPCQTCDALKRLINGLQYYMSLDVQNKQNDKDEFNNFVCNLYHTFLDDYIHLIDIHAHKLENINESLLNKKFKICDITKCVFTGRHEGTNNKNMNEKILDSVLHFYANIMDALHFYVFHLFDVGLRAHASKSSINDDKTKDEKDDTTKYFDKEFSRITSMINERKHITTAFIRFNTNNKFNISVSPKTYLDGMYEYLSSYTNDINPLTVSKLRQYIQDEEFDTDPLQADIDCVEEGNISMTFNDKQLTEAILNFIKAISLQSSAFNIGLTFYYWPAYETMKVFDYNAEDNQFDHDGYEISHLFVQQKNSSFKQEISHYKHFNMKDYNTLVTPKINEYLGTETVKKIKAVNGSSEAGWVNFKYDIPNGFLLSFSHLLCLVLYCDYTELSRDFSASFRALKPFEALSSIKARNANYWWMAKSLRETVQLFGNTWYPSGGRLRGPFYSGLNRVMAFPEFEIRLCSPVSTSTQIAVATRFAGPDGCIVQLNNTVKYQASLHGFSAGWITRFPEESEVIFMGGHYRIKIESVRIISTHQNFEEFFAVLVEFNKIFNGGYAASKHINSNKRRIISSLLNNKLKMNIIDDGIHEYIHQTFDVFCWNNKQIVFNMSGLCGENSDECLTNMMINNIGVGEVSQEINDKTNIFCSAVWEIFPNIQTINICTTNRFGYIETQLSFLGLLSEIENRWFKQITITAVQKKEANISWITLMWSSLSNMIAQKYQSKNFTIHLEKEKKKNADDLVVDCVVIKKL